MSGIEHTHKESETYEHRIQLSKRILKNPHYKAPAIHHKQTRTPH